MRSPMIVDQSDMAEIKRLRDFGLDVSWAGGNPWAPGLCLGTEDGKVVFLKYGDTQPAVPMKISESGEAINGVAFVDSLMAVSTRSEVVFRRGPDLQEGKVGERAIFPAGAHNVVATPNGRIIASLGFAGLMCMTVRESRDGTIGVVKPGGDAKYLYKIAALPTLSASDVIVAAARRGGFITLLLKPEGGNLGSSRQLHGMDVIDVCPIGREYPLGAVALGLDCSIYVIEDVLQKGPLKTLKFDSIGGRAYRVLCSGGHLFVLTSEMLYVFPDMIAGAMNRQEGLSPTSARGIPLEAVDASIVDDEWLVIVMPDDVYLLEIAKLIEGDAARFESRPTSRIGSLELETEGSFEWHSQPFDLAAYV